MVWNWCVKKRLQGEASPLGTDLDGRSPDNSSLHAGYPSPEGEYTTSMQYLYIAVGGALGALARYIVGAWVTKQTGGTFPWGTFVINITGCFILGLVATLLSERVLNNPNWRPFITIGFVGAYTTFSTYEYETAQLGSSWRAMANLAGSVVAGYAAVWVGIQLAHAIASWHVAAKG